MKMLLELFLIVIVTSIAMYFILSGYASKRRINNRIKEFLPSQHMEEEVNPGKKGPSFLKRLFISLSNIFRSVQFSESTEKLLMEAGSKLRPEEFFAVRLLGALGIGTFTSLIGAAWYLFLLTVVIGFLIPKMVIKHKRKKRLAYINYQLIEVLGMMSNSMRAGFSFMQAMQLVGKEMSDPLGPEFDRVVRQTGLGVPIEDVFEEMVNRLPNNELEVVARAILAQRRSGGNLAELLETMEETIRGRVRILEELRTLTAQGRMSSWIITLIPVCLGFYLALVNREYFAPMLQHPLGWMMLIIASISTIIGWIFIRKIIQIEV
ncbi:type II secretion system F family protein [Neobacillus citreus]|uniref:Type II secretion system F family protein n=1 Tax=Neobacillus citreus TaxID=2833578 RepID=A0A942YBK0_9BACI|nr:type II secretion system F family protein [Neobacillus citreus]MCH6267625.1 type II secretion system F family protein [Neobacillus citreus]